MIKEKIEIVYKNVDELREYENNPRNNEKAVAAVAASIELAGFKVPIVIDGNGVIVAGHTRVKAAKRLGMQTVPCIVADDLTDEQIRAFRLADNKVSEQASWDFGKLDAELEALAAAGMDMTAFGFADADDEDGDSPKEREDLSSKVAAVYEVIVECADEYEQEEVFTRLVGEGLQCRVLTL